MNYYEKILLESNVELYANRLDMAIDVLESYGISVFDPIEDPEEIAIESVVQFVLENEEMTDARAKELKKEIDDKMAEFKATKKPGKSLIKNIINLSIGGVIAGVGGSLVIGSGNIADSFGNAAGVGALVAGGVASIGGLAKTFVTRRDMIEDVTDLTDMAKYLKSKIAYVDKLIAEGKGNTEDLKTVRADLVKMKKYCYTHITARTSVGSHSALEAYGLHSAVGTVGKLNLTREGAAKVEKQIADMKKNNDTKALTETCKKTADAACKNKGVKGKIAVGLFITAAAALSAVAIANNMEEVKPFIKSLAQRVLAAQKSLIDSASSTFNTIVNGGVGGADVVGGAGSAVGAGHDVGTTVGNIAGGPLSPQSLHNLQRIQGASNPIGMTPDGQLSSQALDILQKLGETGEA